MRNPQLDLSMFRKADSDNDEEKLALFARNTMEWYITEYIRLQAEIDQAKARKAVLREALESVVYRCEKHCGADGNPNWHKDTLEYQYLKQALSSTGQDFLVERRADKERIKQLEAELRRLNSIIDNRLSMGV